MVKSPRYVFCFVAGFSICLFITFVCREMGSEPKNSRYMPGPESFKNRVDFQFDVKLLEETLQSSSFLIPSIYDDDRDLVKEQIPLRVIPPLLHVQWKNKSLPLYAHRHLHKWHELHPHWRIVLWTDQDIDQLSRFSFKIGPWLRTFRDFGQNIMRVDFSRYLLLYLFGGVYADIDVVPLRSLDPVLEHHSCVVAREPEAYAVSMAIPDGAVLVSNALMASAPGHPFWLFLMDRIVHEPRPIGAPVQRTGPFAMTAVVREMAGQVTLSSRSAAVFLAPSRYFFPEVQSEGEAMHKMMLQKSCQSMQVKDMSRFAREICRFFKERGLVDYSVGGRHPRAFPDSFTQHLMKGSWFEAIRQNGRDVGSLPFSVFRPQGLMKVLLTTSAMDRERQVVHGED